MVFVGWATVVSVADGSRQRILDHEQKIPTRNGCSERIYFWIEMSQRPTSEGQTDKVICWECIAGGEVLKQGTIYYVVEQQPLACGKK